ncbi:MAG TPA: O-antigen ligase family protein [Verrucomicrobiae bacterium]
MNNASAIFRSLVVYAICVPLAIWLGYMLTSLEDFTRSSYIEAAIFALLLCLPLLLRWHYILLVFCINFVMTIFFLPGMPAVWMPMVALSLGISVLQRALNKDMRFISVPRIALPLICLAVVALATARLTGGIGLKSFGGDEVGGRKYFFLIGGILAYFALTARRIPPERAGLYVALFFLSQCSMVIGDLLALLPPGFNFLSWFFPPNDYIIQEKAQGAGGYRFGGLAMMSSAIFVFMLAKYGIRGIFMSGKSGRILMLGLFGFLVLFGGFRSLFILCVMIFAIQFFLEGLHRTRLMPRFVFAGLLVCALAVPFAYKLPYEIQRSLAFLPLNISPIARADAQGSSDWRVEMWKAVLPEVPGHLLLGKGYVLSRLELETMGIDSAFHPITAADWTAALAGDYHSGPLSVVLSFGIWGVIAFSWFLIAAIRALYANYRYGDPALRNINTLLLAAFIGHTLLFIIVFGAVDSDMLKFAGIIGLSVSLNGGIRGPATEPVEASAPALSRPRLQPEFQQQT